MATVLVTGQRFTQVQLNSTNEDIIVSRSGELIVTAGSSILALSSSTSSRVFIDGAVYNDSAEGLRFNATGSVSHDILISQFGSLITGATSIIILGSGAEISNAGSISSRSSGISALDNTYVSNDGTINAFSIGIDLGNSADIANTGIINGDFQGIDVGNGAIIVNSGEITGFEGISGGDDTSITNSGTITGEEHGIQVRDGTITNTGTIAQTADETFDSPAAIEATTAELEILNHGNIIAAQTAIDGELTANVTNTGSITADFSAVTATTINLSNSGIIASNDFAFQADTLVLQNTGQISALFDVFSGGSQSAGTLDVQNSGEITAGSDAFDVDGGAELNNSGSIVANARLLDAGSNSSIVNSGTLAGGSSAQVLIDVVGLLDVVNSGEIIAERQIFDATRLRLTNSIDGDIASGSTAITTGNFNIYNAGNITASGNFIIQAFGTSIIDNTFNNSGTVISGGTMISKGSDGDLDIINSGTLQSLNPGSIVTQIVDNGDISFVNSGTVLSDSNGLNVAGTLTVDNSGTFIASGGTAFSTTSTSFLGVDNTGEIQASQVMQAGESARLNNTGSIIADRGMVNISLSEFETLTLKNTGNIQVVFEAIFGNGILRVENAGTITSQNSLTLNNNNLGSTEIHNTGTIQTLSDLSAISLGSSKLVNSGAITARSLFAQTDSIGIPVVGIVNDSRVTNSGSIVTSSSAVDLTGNIVLRNLEGGTISGLSVDTVSSIPFNSLALIDGERVVVRNSGQLDSGDIGVRAGELDLINNGVMTSYGRLVDMASGYIKNTGQMTSFETVVEVGQNVQFINSATGSVAGNTLFNSSGLFSSLSVVNHGSMSSDQVMFNNMGSGGTVSLINTGQVATDGFFNLIQTLNGQVTVRNSGEMISGFGLVTTDSGSINFFNEGTAQGSGGLMVSAGSQTIVLTNRGTFNVEADSATTTGGSTTVVNSGVMSNTVGFFGPYFDTGLVLTLTNTGSITVGGDLASAGNRIELRNTGDIQAREDLFETVADLRFLNTGTITVGLEIGSFDSGSFVNRGAITAGNGAVFTSAFDGSNIPLPTFTNTGSITTTLGNGFTSQSTKALKGINSGTITAATHGLLVDDFTLNNTGTIQAGDRALLSFGTALKVINDGEMIGDTYGISAVALGGNLTLNNTGLLAGDQGAIQLNQSGSILKLTNSGTINGAIIAGNIDVNNTGTIIADENNAILAGTGGVVRNDGVISGTNVAIGVLGGGTSKLTISNSTTGTISGFIAADLRGSLNSILLNNGSMIGTADLDFADLGAILMDGASGTKIVNAGSINGADAAIQGGALQGSVLIKNSGTLTGGDDVAINLNNDSANAAFGHTIVNSGTILGDVVLSEGDDSYSGRLGEVFGSVDGGGGNDSLRGGIFEDVLIGGAGNDLLRGGDGDDDLRGDDGDDELRGQNGIDLLNGGAGNDDLFGGLGADLLIGGDGEDELNGGDGDDRLEGDAGNDLLKGDNGADTVVGGLGDDTVRGGFGDDELFGNAGNDFLTGDAGVDLLTGGRGNDRIDGGRGVDTVIYSGDIADYTFLLLGNGDIRVTDNVGNDGVDRVSTVEFFEFGDGIVAAADLPF